MSEAWHRTNDEITALGVADSAPGLVAVALSLAEQLDRCEAPTSAAVVARELRATLLELRKLAPPAEEGDALDELAKRRAERRASGTDG
ncbi:hypothetical protein [Streptomyces sp. NBRC 109706]|uniref:hypothetical protein n=1 Tax=Streptomyces sp. NBRC 109706 TaxID=1550035 RepID=UPI000A48AAA9|nr:hypothetical protein [Streptomyces sp. NBRC 109706]